MKLFQMTGIVFILMLLLVACGGESTPASQTTNDEDVESLATSVPPTVQSDTTVQQPPVDSSVDTSNTQQDQSEVVQNVPAQEQTTSDTQTVAYEGGAWTQLQLINARTGETFSFADFAGRTVFVHPMAVWCTNCRANQTVLRNSVVPELNPEEFVFVSLSIETFEDPANLAQYAANNNFDWVFAVVTNEMLSELIATFGTTITNPPAQPHFIIRPNGISNGLITGNVSPSSLIADLQAISQAG